MIDDQTIDGTGSARFSDDRRFRYRLCRALTDPGRIFVQKRGHSTVSGTILRACFVLINPSTADAFKPDRTVSRCVKFGQRWGVDVIEIVNLFALRSTDPNVLYDDARVVYGHCGDLSHLWRDGVGGDLVNDLEIIDACAGASRVIAGWGNHGELGDRGEDVRRMLVGAGVALLHLGMTSGGYPKHPLARGKSFIPYDREPIAWA